MTTETLTLTDFLLARIEEDEAVAKSFHYDWSSSQETLRRRFLADCEAKRRIVEQHGANEYRVDPCDSHDANFESIPCPTLRALAAVYADHPDYREEWRP